MPLGRRRGPGPGGSAGARGGPCRPDTEGDLAVVEVAGADQVEGRRPASARRCRGKWQSRMRRSASGSASARARAFLRHVRARIDADDLDAAPRSDDGARLVQEQRRRPEVEQRRGPRERIAARARNRGCRARRSSARAARAARRSSRLAARAREQVAGDEHEVGLAARPPSPPRARRRGARARGSRDGSRRGARCAGPSSSCGSPGSGTSSSSSRTQPASNRPQARPRRDSASARAVRPRQPDHEPARSNRLKPRTPGTCRRLRRRASRRPARPRRRAA